MNYVLNGAGARAFAATILRPHRTFAYSHPIVIVVCLVFAAPESTEGAGARGRLRKLVKMDRAQMSLQEVWLLGGDDFGADENHLYVRFSDSALHELTARGATFEVVYDDVYAAYREYHKSLVRGLSATFADYHDVDAATEEIRTIAMNHPDIAALEVIGYSVEGRPIHALRISDDASTVDSSEPGIVVLGCHHAREWISVEVPLFFARYLVDNYLRKGDVTRLINYAEVWIVPVVNPDGLVYTRTDRF
ncbi:MAG: M14 family zinc carboxypeptidase, partial [Phycisphaerae bacterium]